MQAHQKAPSKSISITKMITWLWTFLSLSRWKEEKYKLKARTTNVFFINLIFWMLYPSYVCKQSEKLGFS